MSSLLEKLAEHSKIAEIEKTAEQIFIDAFVDELVKLGYDEEFAKQAAILGSLKGLTSKAWGGVKSLVGAKAVPVAANPHAAASAQYMKAVEKMNKTKVPNTKQYGDAFSREQPSLFRRQDRASTGLKQ